MSQATSAARPKRAGEEFAHAVQHSSKKPRFDQRNPSTLAADLPEDDPMLEADVIGKSRSKVKRNAVNIDGYESDSDEDNFDLQARERAKAREEAIKSTEKPDEDDDDDMFADPEQENGNEKGKQADVASEGKKAKEVHFLDADQVRGQTMQSRSGGHVPSRLFLYEDEKGPHGRLREPSVESSSSSGSDGERTRLPEHLDAELAAEVGAGAKKKHAPRLDAFNLKDANEDGAYDDSGNFVRKAGDPEAHEDNWLDGVNKRDIRRAREAQEKQVEEQRRRNLEQDAVLASDAISTLLTHLETGETPLEALQRLNKAKPKEVKVPKWKQKRHRHNAAVDESSPQTHGKSEAELAIKKAVEDITGAADALYTRGQTEIYEVERALLMRQYKRETDTDWVAPAKPEANGGDEETDATYEFRWSDGRDDGRSHGPYDGPTMRAWNDAGFFSEGVEFRRVGDHEWSRVLDVS